MSIKIAVVPLSSPVGEIEQRMGTEIARLHGLELSWASAWDRRHRFYAGTAEERARAFYDAAVSGEHQLIWNARGGYGAIQLLPFLERWTVEEGVPPSKLLIGSSDTTALFGFVMERWGWSVLHANMPGNHAIHEMNDAEWSSLVAAVKRDASEQIERGWSAARLTCWTDQNRRAEGRLLGGNLAVLSALLGTPFFPRLSSDDILFLEDVTESYSRLDRMWDSLRLSGVLDRVQAVMIGNLLDCKDSSPQVLSHSPLTGNGTPQENKKKPLRPVVSEDELFSAWAYDLESRGKGFFTGLPAGHGPRFAPLPFGARILLDGEDPMRLLKWDWLDTSN